VTAIYEKSVAPAVLSDGDPLPRRFGRYVLFDKIGEGGMARIYLGRTKTDLGGERLVVVKQILPLLSASSEFSQLLIGEAKVVAALSHGNIAQVFDLGREGETLYIAMEYVEGFDLRDLLKHCSKNRVPLPVEFALLIVIEALRALDYAHRKKDDAGRELGIVHRDVSPSNVLISFDGEVKLCDFGIARAMGASGSLPDEAIQGKTGYMSPEAAQGAVLDARSDVFAAGIILWELLAGRRLYRGEGGQPPSLDQAAAAQILPLENRGYPHEDRLHDIVMHALKKDRGERYDSARAVLRDLESYVARSGLVASPLRFGEWLMQHFGAEIVERRRARERAAKAVEAGPLLELSPPSQPSGAPPPVAPVANPIEPPPPSLEAMVASSVPRPEPRGAWRWLVFLIIVAVAATVAAVMILR
jgi:eukaryotic-like serine/threonine-protein kinase